MDHVASKLAHNERTPSAKLAGFIGDVWHPEDLIALEGTPWVIVSAMRGVRDRGALLVVDRSAPDFAFELEWSQAAECGRRGVRHFDPHGIDARRVGAGSFELLVVDHGGGEAIDRLVLDTRNGRPIVVSGERIDKPDGTSGNAVAFLPDGGFLMTSMFDPRDHAVVAKFSAAEATGGVWRWSTERGWSRVGPDLSGANGIAACAKGEWFVVSEWAARRLWRMSLGGEVLARADVDFLPDNLRAATDSSLLLAGQKCRPEELFGSHESGAPCPLGFTAARIDPESLGATTLVDMSHAEAQMLGFGGATGALQIDEEIWVGSFTGERIARFRL